MSDRRVALCSAVYKGAESQVLDGFMRAAYRLGRETTDEFLPILATRKRAELAANYCLMRMEEVEEQSSMRFTHILWVDDDVVIDGDVAQRLLDTIDHDHPVVAALAFERAGQFRPAIWEACRFGQYMVSVKQMFDYPPDQLVPVVASGLCCVAFDRDVFEVIRKPYFDWIQPGYKRESCTPDGYLFAQFDDHCIPCWCHTGIKVGHIAAPVVVDEAYAQAHKGEWGEAKEIPCRSG